ncbi:MAG: HNH endonuclease [Cyanobacteria bacterium J06649_4]
MKLRNCLRDPIPEIYTAAKYLDAAVSAHNFGNRKLATELFLAANMSEVRDWTESLWGKNSPHLCLRDAEIVLPVLPKAERVSCRMPNKAEREILHERDGFHCRFCGIPVIRKEIREVAKAEYPNAVQWGRTNFSQHAAFQAMWLQYNHLIPHSRGGNNDIENVVITCAPCNYGRGNRLIEEVGVRNPFERPPVKSQWDGLERIRKGPFGQSSSTHLGKRKQKVHVG